MSVTGFDPSHAHTTASVPLRTSPDGGAPIPHADVPPAVRAQVLATEHWSLLATRATTWSEVMSRITIHLTVSSAALVVLALTAQATGFGPVFRLLSIGLASAILVLGTLTGLRVHMASAEDALLLTGMNRLRAAYRDIDPGIEPYLVASWHDDSAGLRATYTLGLHRSTFLHVVGSTAMFMNAVNTIVAGTLGALVADAAGASTAAVVVLGAIAGLSYLAVMVEAGRRRFACVPGIPSHFPTPAD
jgi:hypothetical protein